MCSSGGPSSQKEASSCSYFSGTSTPSLADVGEAHTAIRGVMERPNQEAGSGVLHEGTWGHTPKQRDQGLPEFQVSRM